MMAPSEASARRAIIVGAGGQDGRLLAERLGQLGYELSLVTRESLDIQDPAGVAAFVADTRPDEIYYLAAYHHSSQDSPIGQDLAVFERSYQTHARGLIHFLEAALTRRPQARTFYAASSLAFGTPEGEVCDETTPLRPTAPYGITKAMGVQIARYYRQQHHLHVSTGFLFNHESKLRQEKFLSKKIIRCAQQAQAGEKPRLQLGDLSAEVDWGYAPDYVEAMRLILGLEAGDDFVISTGIKHTVRDFLEAAFGPIGLKWQDFVTESPGVLTRRNPPMIGNPAKLKAMTGWKPSVDFMGMVRALLD